MPPTGQGAIGMAHGHLPPAYVAFLKARRSVSNPLGLLGGCGFVSPAGDRLPELDSGARFELRRESLHAQSRHATGPLCSGATAPRLEPSSSFSGGRGLTLAATAFHGRKDDSLSLNSALTGQVRLHIGVKSRTKRGLCCHAAPCLMQ